MIPATALWAASAYTNVPSAAKLSSRDKKPTVVNETRPNAFTTKITSFRFKNATCSVALRLV